MSPATIAPPDYDTVELRAGFLNKIRRSLARQLGDQDGMVEVVKCYCRTHDVLTSEDAEIQRHPAFVFPIVFFRNLEALIGRELQGRIYSDTRDRRVKFFLDLKEHAGFQLEEGTHDLHSPWYDDSVLKD